MPVFDLIERMMMQRLNFPPGVALRLVARSAYVGKMPKFESKLTYVLYSKFVHSCIEL